MYKVTKGGPIPFMDRIYNKKANDSLFWFSWLRSGSLKTGTCHKIGIASRGYFELWLVTDTEVSKFKLRSIVPLVCIS